MLAVDGFLKHVLRSGLVSREQLHDALRSLPGDRRDDPQAVADSLVKRGRLSRFQARKLLQGKSRGLVLGPYQVLAPIGKGGMGTVYLARDAQREQLMALKVLPPKRAREEERHLARFRREMELCQRVAHPNLAQTYEVGVCQGVYYIAMEFIPGRSLYRLVSDEGPLAVPRAARLMAEAAAGLDHAHQRGLIHRDLKPSNIMVTPNDHAKVLDLGLALIEGEEPADRTVVGGQGYVVGTMDYIAPEQADDPTKVDARADLYSLGCTLYFALTGRPPFPGGSSLQKIRRHRNEDPIPVVRLNPAVPPGFADLVARLMAKRPQDRLASAADLREEMLRWAGSDPGLPADRAGDSNYERAVAELEDAEPDDDLPEALPAEPAPRRHRPAFRPAAPPPVLARAVAGPRWLAYAVAAVVGALAGLAIVAVWWLTR